MSLSEAFWAAPPVSRTITAATVLISVPGYIGVYKLVRFFFLSDYIFTLRRFPEVWRLVTCFFISGPNMGIILDPFMLYTHGSQLETGSTRFRRPGSFFVYLVFVSVFILLTGGLCLGGFVLLPALSMAITYTYAQEDPNRQIVLFVLPMAAKYLPYASLALTFVTAGPGMVYLQATGILAGHAYDFLDRIWPQYGGGSHLIATPEFVEKWFAGMGFEGARPAGGEVVNDPSQRQTGAGRGFTSGFSSGSFGAGRRLGGT